MLRETSPMLGTNKHAAKLPVPIYEDLKRRGIIDDEDAFKRWLNSSEAAPLARLAELGKFNATSCFLLFLVFLLSGVAARAVPVDCSGTIVTGATAVQAIAPNFIKGYRVFNLDTSEALWANTTSGTKPRWLRLAAFRSPLARRRRSLVQGSLITSDTLSPNAPA